MQERCLLCTPLTSPGRGQSSPPAAEAGSPRLVQPGVCPAPQGGLGQGHEHPKRGVTACPEGPVPKERDCRSRQSSWAERKVHAARGLSSGRRALKILGICCVWCAKEMPLGGRAGEATPEGFKMGLVAR